MASLGELSVLIGAEVNEAGFTRAVNAIGGIETAAKSAGAGAATGMNQVGTAADAAAAVVDKASQRITDAQGRVRDGYGKFVTAAQLAAEAAGNVGGSLGNLSDVAGRASSSINAGLVSSFAAFDKAVKPIDAGLGRLGKGLQDVGTGLTTYVTLPLAGLATAAVLAAAKVDSLTRGLQAVTQQELSSQGVTGLDLLNQSAKLTQDRLKELREVAKLPGLGFTEAIQGSIRLQAVGLSADRAKAVLLAFGNAIATTGGGKSELDRVTVQLGQLSAKGKVLAQDLRPIIEAAPAAATALRKLYGTVDSETISKSLEEQGKSSTDFIDTLTTELGKLPKVTGGLAIAGENLSDSLTLAGSGVGLIADKLFDLSGIANSVGGAIEGLAESFGKLDPTTQKLVFGLAAAAAAAGPLVFGVGTVIVAVAEFQKALIALELSAGAVFAPLAIGAAVVAVVVYEVIEHWDDLVSYFSQSGEGGRVFSDLADSVSNAVSQINSAFSGLNGGGGLDDLISATGILKAAFRDVAVGITAVANVIGGTVGAIVALLKGDLSGAADQAARGFAGLVQPLANALGFQLRLADSSELVRKGFEGAAHGGGIFGDELLHLSGLLPGFNTQLQGFAGGFPNAAKSFELYGGLLEKLRARLEKLQAQREKEYTVGAIRVDTAQIEAVQKQIDDLIGKSSKGTDVVAKLRQEIARLAALDNILGDTPGQMEVLDRRVTALTNGLKTLVDAGVSTGSRAFRSFAADLANTGQALAKLRGAGGALDLKPIALKSLIPRTLGDTLPQDVARLLGDYANKPIELPLHLEIKPIVDNSIKGSIQDGLLSAVKGLDTKGLGAPLVDYGNALNGVSKTAQAFGGALAAMYGGFDAGNAKIQAAQSYLQDLLARGFDPLHPAVRAAIQDLRDYSLQAEDTKLITATIQSGFEALGTSIGAALGDGTSVLAAALGGLIDVLADYAGKKGKLIIADGLVDLITPGLQAIGAAKIAGGTALLVAAGVARAGAASLSASSAGASLASQPKTDYGSSTVNQPQQKLLITAEFKLRGQDLIAAGQLQQYRTLRTQG